MDIKMTKIDIKIMQKFLDNITLQIDNAKNNIEINTIIENLVQSMTDSQKSSLWIYDEQKAILLREREESQLRELSVQTKKGLLYSCFATKKAFLCNNLSTHEDFDETIDNPDKINIKSKIMIPLIDDDKFLGILTAYSSYDSMDDFSNDDLEMMQAISPYVINAIFSMKANNIKTQKPEFERRSTDTIKKLKDIEESRDNTHSAQEILDYTSNIVHDIRTPANGLFGFLELLEEQLEHPRLKKYIHHAKESASLINDLTTSILDGVSRKREMQKSKVEKVNSSKFFADIAEIFSANMYKKQINYNIYIDTSLPKEVSLEGIKIKRIIMNLISNAYKFTPTNSSIEFSVRYKAKDKRIHIFIKDTGIGIRKDKQEQIFEAFKQAEEDTGLNYGGTGLGLAICAGYVKELGGKLSIDSTPNKGSTFYFDIPLELDDETPKFNTINNSDIEIAVLMSPENKITANNIARYLVKMGIGKANITAITNLNMLRTNTSHIISFENKFDDATKKYIEEKSLKALVVEENLLSLEIKQEGILLISEYGYYADSLYSFVDIKNLPRVLIVDDDKISVTLIKTILEDELCEISIAYDGETGLEMLKSAASYNRPYKIAFVDNYMPGITGHEVLEKFRNFEKENKLSPVKAISISGESQSDKDIKKLFDIYVSKPFNLKDILSIYHNITYTD